jgi:hypothetical protein
VRNPEFIEEARHEKLDINSLAGKEVQKYVGQMVSTPKQVSVRLKKAIRATH